MSKKYAALQALKHRSVGGLAGFGGRAPGSMPIAIISSSASLLNGNGDSMPAVPPLAIHSLPPGAELVALGVAAEVVVVVEDQDARACGLVRAR